MSVYKRISLGDQYLIVIFVFENWNLAAKTASKNKVINTNIFAF